MKGLSPDQITEWVHNHTNADPSDNTGNPAELFKGYEVDSFDAEIADLWRWGIVDIDREDGEQYIKLSKFGEEIWEKGFSEMYIDAQLGHVPDDVDVPEKPAVRVLEQ